MRSNPFIKLLAVLFSSIVIGILLLVYFTNHSSHPAGANNKTAFVNDKASSDTPVETLKTLTSDISAVEQQNQKIIDQNKRLSDQDKTTLANFKNDMLQAVQKQIADFKTAASTPSVTSNKTSQPTPTAIDNLSPDNSASSMPLEQLTWINDMQNMTDSMGSNPAHSASSSIGNLSGLLNSDSSEKGHAKENQNTQSLLQNLENKNKNKKPTVPYYTIPVNATLTGAIAMQPIIGRIPISGKVPDPYTFKVIIGAKNLAANGIDIPEDIQGIVASGVAEGDLLGRCARGDINSMTFIFQDGRISTTQAKEGQRLGTIAAANGNPCIQGSFHTDAPLFLSVTAGLAGLQGYSNALSQSQVSNMVTPAGSSFSTLIGNANRYAMGQGFSAAAQATQHWWEQRVENSFDFVYVPNVDLKTGKKLALNINITQEIPIDYNPEGRKVAYDQQNNFFKSAPLD